MKLIIDNHKFQYEMEKLCRIFCPNEKIETVFSDGDGVENYVKTSIRDGNITVSAKIDGKGKQSNELIAEEDKAELQMAKMLFGVLSEITETRPSWGILTGIRPSKLMMNEIEKSGREHAEKFFRDEFLVSEEKACLAANVAETEKKIIEQSKNDSMNLYISVPFCPTRCNYCSFVSHSIERTRKLIEPYVENLCEEIAVTGEITNNLGLKLDTVYIGGGTPTTLDENQLEKIIISIKNSFDMSKLSEFTVEAGRPDTVTKGKLLLLKKYGVDRISINPQTFNDEVLLNIGRRHTAEDFYRAFYLARECGFDNINTDLIAGLTGDTYDSFCRSIDKAAELSPENITVHTLSLKSSSYLVTENEEVTSNGEITAEMTKYARKTLEKNDYMAYYMYRQSKSVGNLENVGWCKENRECAYNIFMMEECASVFSCGAGAVTKLKAPGGEHIERIFNYKYPYEYNDRFKDAVERKRRITEFYNEYRY